MKDGFNRIMAVLNAIDSVECHTRSSVKEVKPIGRYVNIFMADGYINVFRWEGDDLQLFSRGR